MPISMVSGSMSMLQPTIKVMGHDLLCLFLQHFVIVLPIAIVVVS